MVVERPTKSAQTMGAFGTESAYAFRLVCEEPDKNSIVLHRISIVIYLSTCVNEKALTLWTTWKGHAFRPYKALVDSGR